MKIKSDFVTNSSSTAYVVMIPEDFILTENMKMLNGIHTRYCEKFVKNMIL